MPPLHTLSEGSSVALVPEAALIVNTPASPRPAHLPLQIILLGLVLCPGVTFCQVASRDSAAYARAERLSSRADTVAQSNDRASSLQALALWREAVPLYEMGHHLEKVAGIFHRIAVVYYNVDRLDSALAYFARALPIERGLRDRPGEARTLHDIGRLQSDLGRPDSALAYYARELPIRREVGDRSGEAATLNNIGGVHAEVGRPDSALRYYARALPIERAAGERSGEATTLNNIGLVQSDLGRPDSALAYFARALPVQRELGDRGGEATTLNNIGMVHDNVGRPDSALAYYARALRISREVADRAGEATTLHNIGAVQFELGRPDSALTYYANALKIQREVGDRAGESRTLNNIGGVHSSLGRPDSAMAYYARGLSGMREVGDRAGEARTLNNIGLVQRDLGRSDSALTYFVRALPIRRAVGDRSGEATTLHNIGLVQSDLGRPDSALAYYALALPISREVGDRTGEAATLHNIGYVLLRSTDDRDAWSAAAMFDSAAALRARVRRSAGGDANAVSLGETGGDTYTAWSRAWQRLAGQARTAGDSLAFNRAVASSLAAAERGRGQALRDLLDRRPGARRVGVDATDTLAGADLAAEVSRLLAPLRSAHIALLYYLTDGDTLRSWFLSSDGALRFLPAIAQSNGERADRIMKTRAQTGATPVRGVGVGIDPAAALALHNAVLPADLTTLLPAGTELVIVPHGALGQVPFAALTLPGDSVPLGVRNPLRYAPSLRALDAAEAAAAPTTRRALVVGNPLMPQVRDETGALHQLWSLPGAASEGQWVATRLGTQVLTGAAASESAVRRLLSGAWVVHLATHGLAYGTEARVRDSYVALAPGDGNDGLLTLGELLDDESLHLSADLIVLSACQTGLGEAREAEGTVGLQRGLLAKGARSVLVSLWSVDDAATRLLMERFYMYWLDSNGRPVISKAEALRRAQRDVRAQPRFRDPRYWAAFQLVGAR